MKRDGDVIIFDSVAQKSRWAASIDVGTDEFMEMILRVIAASVRTKAKAWDWMVDQVGDTLENGETFQYDYATEKLMVVKIDTKKKLHEETDK